MLREAQSINAQLEAAGRWFRDLQQQMERDRLAREMLSLLGWKCDPVLITSVNEEVRGE